MTTEELNEFMDKLYSIVKTEIGRNAVDSLIGELTHVHHVAGYVALCRLLVTEYSRASLANAKYQKLCKQLYIMTAGLDHEIFKNGGIH